MDPLPVVLLRLLQEDPSILAVAPNTLITSTRKLQSTSASSNDYSWPGQCAGADCKTKNDCSDDLVCDNGKYGT
ncbi:hypothetical protein RUND412_007508 [Rhizina undulata]